MRRWRARLHAADPRHSGSGSELVHLISSRQTLERTPLTPGSRISVLREADMPFAGELIQVREDERDWEGAAERLLRSFGLSLLVPCSRAAPREQHRAASGRQRLADSWRFTDIHLPEA